MGKRIRLAAKAPPALQGLSGVVERVAGHFPPGAGEAKAPLYRLRIALADLWGREADGFGLEDTLDVEMFEPALEPFFDYKNFEAEKARLEGELTAQPGVDDDARLQALAQMKVNEPAHAEIRLEPERSARHVLIAGDLDPSALDAALRRPRKGLAESDSALALRLHLASGRIRYVLG